MTNNTPQPKTIDSRDEYKRMILGLRLELEPSIANDVERIITHQLKLAELRGRIDELGKIQLEYGHYVAQTFMNGQAMTLEERIAELQAELEGLGDI